MLRVSGLTLESALASDAFEVVIDHRGELAAVLLEVHGSEGRPPVQGLDGALGVVRAALLARKPIYEIVSELRTWTAAERHTSCAVIVLRFSLPDSRVEILNAGMPAIACALPDGRVSLHPGLSAAIGETFEEVHPYELSPLVWGSKWFLLSSGLTAGSLAPEATRSLMADSEVQASLTDISGKTPDALAPLLGRLRGRTPEAQARDATLLVVDADPRRRFHSGFQPSGA